MRKVVFGHYIFLPKNDLESINLTRPLSIVKEILIDAKQAIKIAIQIAKGVDYLHQNLEIILPKLQLNSKHIMVKHF
jgi:hypothetical protein